MTTTQPPSTHAPSILDSIRKAGTVSDRFVNVLIYGRAGLGKTLTALHVAKTHKLRMLGIDADGGLSAYAAHPWWRDVFDYITTEDPLAVTEAVEQLVADPRGYGMLTLDPITTLHKHVGISVDDENKRKRARAGQAVSPYQSNTDNFAEIRVSDRIGFQLLSGLRRVGVPTIVTAWEKARWSGGVQIGFEPDVPRKGDHHFDIVVRLVRESPTVPVRAVIEKDRLRRLDPAGYQEDDPNSPPWKFATALATVYADLWTRRPEARPRASEEQVAQLYALQESMKLDPRKVVLSLMRYGVDTFDDLSPTQADEIAAKLTGKQ